MARNGVRRPKSGHSLPDAGGRAGAPFSVDFARRLEDGQVVVRWIEQPRPTTPELEALIEQVWQERTAVAARAGQDLYNGEMAGLIRGHEQGETVALYVGLTDYRRFVGTNYCNGHRVGEFGIDAFANPVGTSATVVTEDRCLLFGRRGRHLACHGGYLHVFGGSLEPRDRAEDGTLEAFEAMRRELREELKVNDGEVVGLVCTGMVRDLALHQPELCFDAVLGLTREEVLARFDPEARDQEHAGLEWCDDQSTSVVWFIRGAELMAPAAIGAALLHGRCTWGVTWYERTCRALFGELPPRTSNEILAPS